MRRALKLNTEIWRPLALPHGDAAVGLHISDIRGMATDIEYASRKLCYFVALGENFDLGFCSVQRSF